ncbi:hypothetical protein ISCGN_001005 [Ixodes scapularis]
MAAAEPDGLIRKRAGPPAKKLGNTTEPRRRRTTAQHRRRSDPTANRCSAVETDQDIGFAVRCPKVCSLVERQASLSRLTIIERKDVLIGTSRRPIFFATEDRGRPLHAFPTRGARAAKPEKLAREPSGSHPGARETCAGGEMSSRENKDACVRAENIKHSSKFASLKTNVHA